MTCQSASQTDSDKEYNTVVNCKLYSMIHLSHKKYIHIKFGYHYIGMPDASGSNMVGLDREWDNADILAVH